MTRDDDAAEMTRLYRLEAAAMRMVLGQYRADLASQETSERWGHLVEEAIDDIDQVIAQMPVEDVRAVAYELAEKLADTWSKLNPDNHIRWVEGRIAFLLDRAEKPLDP